ncbi:MAG: hypothetical protein AB3N06_05905 [Erythrobacter sp.]
MRLIRAMAAVCGLLMLPNAANAQSDEWFVGSHPDYHAAMVRDVDGFFVAVYVAKEPSIYASPLLMETLAPTCGAERPIEMHSTQAIMAFGPTAEERLAEVRTAVEDFFNRSVRSCPIADDFEARFFYRFDDAYLATDALLIEAEIFPLEDGDE